MKWIRILLLMQGSVLPKILGRVLLVTVCASAVTYHHTLDPEFWKAELTPLPFSLIGVALSIFLGFRNNTAYDRFWEGRKLWGRLINTTRSWSRQVLSLVDEGTQPPTLRQRELVREMVGYVHGLRAWLRFADVKAAAGPHLAPPVLDALEGAPNPPARILQHLGAEVARTFRDGALNAYHLPALDKTLSDLTDIQGGCERIRNTPIPFAYTALMHRIVAIYCFALPFGIIEEVGTMTPFVVAFVSYAFFGLDAIGEEIEEPFGFDPNDLPLDQLSNVIERDLIFAIGDAPPPARVPVDRRLT